MVDRANSDPDENDDSGNDDRDWSAGKPRKCQRKPGESSGTGRFGWGAVSRAHETHFGNNGWVSDPFRRRAPFISSDYTAEMAM